MCAICSLETGIKDVEAAHAYVGDIIRHSFKLGFGNPFMISGCLCVFSNVTDEFYRLNTWQGLSAFLDSVEED
jgi:hypothetical protein